MSIRRYSQLRIILKNGIEVVVDSKHGFTVQRDGEIVEPESPHASIAYLDPNTIAMIVNSGGEEQQSICPHPSCMEVLDGNTWACRDHWYSLPGHVRETLMVAQRGVQMRPTPEYQRRLDQAEQKALEAWESADREGDPA